MTSSPDHRMFWRLWLRALSVKRPQAIVSAVSLLVGAAIISTLLNLYRDVRRKMTEEFSAYGANVVLAPRQSGSQPTRLSDAFPAPSAEEGQPLAAQSDLLDQHLLERLRPVEQQVKGLIAVPRFDLVVRVMKDSDQAQGTESVVAVATGADFGALKMLNPKWRLEGHAARLRQDACAVGGNLATRLGLKIGDGITIIPDSPGDYRSELSKGSGRIALAGSECVVSSIISSGSVEDNQVFLPLEAMQDVAATTILSVTAAQSAPASGDVQAVQKWVSLVELYAPGTTQEVEGVIRQLTQAFAGTNVEVRPVRRILYSEGKVLRTIRGLVLWLTGFILVIVALCVTATMAAIVLERRKDIAVMKALGASNRRVMLLFLAEGATLGLLAGIAGCFAGGILAGELAQRLFGISLHWVWWAWPVVCCGTVLITVMASLSPLRSARTVEPAVVLKGG